MSSITRLLVFNNAAVLGGSKEDGCSMLATLHDSTSNYRQSTALDHTVCLCPNVTMDGDTARHEERVRVAVRVRPRNVREESIDAISKQLQTMEVDAAAGQIYVCKKKPKRADRNGGQSDATEREFRCHYDRVFGPAATQDEVFDYVRDSVQQIAQGFNCTIFTYGQTGTGKTHTMLGSDLEKSLEGFGTSSSINSSNISAATPRESWGIIPRAIESLFDELASIAHHGAAAAIVHCSYMQIYNNEVYDLLQENRLRMKEPLAVREMIKGNAKHVYASGLSEFRVAGLEETLKLLRQGNKNRTIRATEYNEKSSRSHALLQLSIEVESRGVEGPTTIIRRAKLNLVDLAGSEKWDTDVSMGADRCKELTSINQSLSALGNVISALANAKRTHVPYRDSKLTRLLQDSLGGNTRTTVIATISQDESAIEESISTLLFADRAKCVTLRVKANEVVDDAVLLAEARREIARLRLLVKKNAAHEQMNALEQKITKLTRENTVLMSENRRLKQSIATMKKDKDKTELHSAVVVSSSPSMARSARYPTLQLHMESATPVKPTETERPISRTAIELEDEITKQQAHAQLLEQIQSERRVLERQLEQLELQQTPRRRDDDGQPADTEASQDELCPMCGLVIDDHTDNELDACIEQESAVSRDKMPAQPTQQPSVPGHRVRRTPHSLPAKKPTTPRFEDPSSTRKPPSPYLQQLFVNRPSPVVPRPPATQPKQQVPPQAATLTPQRRSVRDLTATRTENNSNHTEDPSPFYRPSTADSHAKSNQSQPASRSRGSSTTSTSNVQVIVHQGSKSVKALKQFQATSPYNASTTTQRLTSSSNNTTETHSPPDSHFASGADRITCSLRDIGLSLLIYKFRYDCWYPCSVVGFDAKRRLHCCQYEYGDKQWQELGQNKVQVVGRHV